MSEPPVALALWGLLGAFSYASQRLITSVLGDERLTPKRVRRAWAEFALAVVFGPGAAVALTPVVVRLAPHATPAAAALAIGLAANACRPVFVEVVAPGFRRAFGDFLTELGSKISGDKA